jgi:hypothetical protein
MEVAGRWPEGGDGHGHGHESGEGREIRAASAASNSVVAAASAEIIAERVEKLNELARSGNRHPSRLKRHRFESSEDTSAYVITGLSFKAFSKEAKEALSVRPITDSTLYEQGLPRDDAPMSLYLGSISPSQFCKTCANPGGSMGLCAGHFGHISLARPVYHPCWRSTRYTIKFLKMVCYWCSHPLHDATKMTAKSAKKAIPQLQLQPRRKVCTNPECGAKHQPDWVRTNSNISTSWSAKVVFESPEEEAHARTPFTVRLAMSTRPARPTPCCCRRCCHTHTHSHSRRSSRCPSRRRLWCGCRRAQALLPCRPGQQRSRGRRRTVPRR